MFTWSSSCAMKSIRGIVDFFRSALARLWAPNAIMPLWNWIGCLFVAWSGSAKTVRPPFDLPWTRLCGLHWALFRTATESINNHCLTLLAESLQCAHCFTCTVHCHLSFSLSLSLSLSPSLTLHSPTVVSSKVVACVMVWAWQFVYFARPLCLPWQPLDALTSDLRWITPDLLHNRRTGFFF